MTHLTPANSIKNDAADNYAKSQISAMQFYDEVGLVYHASREEVFEKVKQDCERQKDEFVFYNMDEAAEQFYEEMQDFLRD